MWTSGTYTAPGLAAGPAGQVYLADTFSNAVRMVPARTGVYFGRRMRAGDVCTIAGAGSLAAGVAISWPGGLAVDGNGNVLIAGYADNLVRVVAAGTGTFCGLAMRTGHVCTIAGGGTQTASGVVATTASLEPIALAVDHFGNVLVSDEITAFDGQVRVVAARTGAFYGQHMTAVHACILAGGGTSVVPGGRPAAKIILPSPEGIAISAAGEILVQEMGTGCVILIHP